MSFAAANELDDGRDQLHLICMKMRLCVRVRVCCARACARVRVCVCVCVRVCMLNRRIVGLSKRKLNAQTRLFISRIKKRTLIDTINELIHYYPILHSKMKFHRSPQ